jgi:hypothetical protein
MIPVGIGLHLHRFVTGGRLPHLGLASGQQKQRRQCGDLDHVVSPPGVLVM